jgi:DNA-binding MarR family transcriptional regulator|nr:MarR family winged helix-turn-helix transcriptional regulator [Neorhizobium tomejilense]
MSQPLFTRITAFLEVIRELDTTMTVQALQIFTLVAAKGEVGALEIRKTTGISQPSVSRSLSALSSWAPRKGVEGLGLIVTERDPNDARNVIARLTPHGRNLVSRIEKIMGA